MPRRESMAGHWGRRLLAGVTAFDSCCELAPHLSVKPQASAVRVLAVAHEDAARRGHLDALAAVAAGWRLAAVIWWQT